MSARSRAARLGATVVAAISLVVGLLPATAGAGAASASTAPARHRSGVPAASHPPVLRFGDENGSVKVLQRALGVRPVSGYFGKVTQRAVLAFQKRHGIRTTGVVAELTWGALGSRASRAAARVAPAGRVVRGKSCPAESFWWGDGWGADRGYRMHTGQDLMGHRGTPIYAIADGYVLRAGYQSNGGLTLTLRTSMGDFFYGHQYDNTVSVGQRVEAGELIAKMGDTGSPGAVHLHIEWWPHGWQGSGEASARDIEPMLRAIC